MLRRPRRNRRTDAIRALVCETTLEPRQLIAPLFISATATQPEPIPSMPGVDRLPLTTAVHEVERLYKLGIRSVDLFIVIPPEQKDPIGSQAFQQDNFLSKAISTIKTAVPDMCVMADIALDPFTDHGHDGWVNAQGEILNDETVEALIKMSLTAAHAGVDFVAPSDMMDGRVKAIRQALDNHGFQHVGILAYAAKFASAFYGPFRDALQSTPKFGDKKSYQLNPANRREAVLESLLDIEEGADMLLVKPALPYLDVISKIRQETNLPLGAYHVSGEYAMVMAAAQNGWLDARKVLLESLLSIRRAGADFILTYAARQAASWLRDL